MLADSGPLIALFDGGDRAHRRVKRFWVALDQIPLTTWPVLTEVCHMLDFNPERQQAFLTWVGRGALRVCEVSETAITDIARFMNKYRDLPMDLADASLLVLATKTGVRDIVTLDSDFDVYRLADKSRLTNLLAA